MGMSVELLDWDDFHPVGDVMSLFWLGTDCHKTAFAEDLESGLIQAPLCCKGTLQHHQPARYHSPPLTTYAKNRLFSFRAKATKGSSSISR